MINYLDFVHDCIVHESFNTVWLVGFITLTAIIILIQAIATSIRGNGFDTVPIALGITISALWPFVLLCIVIPVAPFFLAYWLTQWIAKKIYSIRKTKELHEQSLKN